MEALLEGDPFWLSCHAAPSSGNALIHPRALPPYTNVNDFISILTLEPETSISNILLEWGLLPAQT
jgi:hypothetical protein